MSCFNFGGNNCCWIPILILLFCCCGNNNSIGNYDYLSTYSTGIYYPFGNSQTAGILPTLSNELLELFSIYLKLLSFLSIL